MKVGEKILVNKTYTEYCVTKCRKGVTGTLKDFCKIETFESGLPVSLNGALIVTNKNQEIQIPLTFIESYKLQTKPRIEDLSHDDLIERIITLAAHEPQTKMGTQKRLKMNQDIQRCKEELLRRIEQA